MVLHSKAIRYELGEKNTKYFLGFEKINAKSKVMATVHTEEGETIMDPKAILTQQKSFYQRLYTSNDKIRLENLLPASTQISQEKS